jgi:hypothetical protein
MAGETRADLLTLDMIVVRLNQAADALDAVGKASPGMPAGAFNAYADDLTTAQNGMERARGIALAGGLQLQGDMILDPGPAPAQPIPPAGAGPRCRCRSTTRRSPPTTRTRRN